MSRFRIDADIALKLGQCAWEAARDQQGTSNEKRMAWDMLSENDQAWWSSGAVHVWCMGQRGFFRNDEK